jgi:hypothetical protein
MNRIVRFSLLRTLSILIVAACTSAAFAAPQTPTAPKPVVDGSKSSNSLVAGPGIPMPILPTDGKGKSSETSPRLVAGPGIPMPILPTDGKGKSSETGNIRILA